MEQLYNQIKALTENEPDLIANLSNISACIYDYLDYINWAGFYLVKDNQLVLGPFQGKPACIRIPIGKGVCGTCVQLKKSLCVPDVHQFAGHIACDSASNSELVLPIFNHGKVVAVLDLDSPKLNRFSQEEKRNFEKIADYIGHLFSR